MLIDKADLLKTLRVIQGFDSNASPYIGVQLVPDGVPRFYRSGAFGFVMGREYSSQTPTNVSLSHLLDRLKVLREEKVEIDTDHNGILKLSSTENTFDSELRIHTVPQSQAGLKTHTVGDIAVRLDPGVFAGIDPSPFKVKVPPVLAEGRLMLATSDAVVLWTGPDSLRGIRVYPREAFLRMACGNSDIREVVLTANGYWGVATSELVMFNYGHGLGRELFDAYNIPSIEIVRFPADRLVYSLKAVAGLGEKDKVEIDPKLGVTSKDRWGSDAKFGLGGTAGFTKFAIMGSTAKAIADALSQSKDEEAVLSSVQMTHPTLRLRRGPFEVNFKTI